MTHNSLNELGYRDMINLKKIVVSHQPFECSNHSPHLKNVYNISLRKVNFRTREICVSGLSPGVRLCYRKGIRDSVTSLLNGYYM